MTMRGFGADRSKRHCAPWCGRGCTEREYQRALRLARTLAGKLGKGWKPDVWENMGWYARALSPCLLVKVHVHTSLVGRASYSAFLGKGDFSGRWTAQGSDPKKVVRDVIRAAQLERAKIDACLKSLEKIL